MEEYIDDIAIGGTLLLVVDILVFADKHVVAVHVEEMIDLVGCRIEQEVKTGRGVDSTVD
jgi:hypothetical protein